MMIVAFGSVPKDGGTYTFYRNMRPALLEQGIDLRCVSLGRDQADLWDERYADEGCVLLAPCTRNVKRQAQAFAEWCEDLQVDLAMGINSEAILSALPHLPERIRCLSRCANSFAHGYRITLSCKERLAAIVAQTPRQVDDLIGTYGADPKKIRLIPNGIDPAPFEAAAATPRGQGPLLQLGFLGRLEHNQKGVLFLPEIVRHLERRSQAFRLRIAGKGKHRGILERSLRAEIDRGRVEFLGALQPQDIPQFLRETDIFLFTSQFEGCPNALLEAMMAGCPVVSWKLEGITDFVLGTGSSLCEIGDCASFAEQIAELGSQRSVLRETGKRAAERARAHFRGSDAALRYASLFKAVMAAPAPSWRPRPWQEFQGDSNFPHSWKDHVPHAVKSRVKAFIRSA